jgi:peptide/nickel transport system permease protein
MIRHLTRTVLQFGLVLLAAALLNFALPRLAPGDPIDFLLPPEQAGVLTPAQRTSILAQFGLDRPLPVQFGRYVAGIARGDFHYSVRYGRPVRDLLLERLPWTLLLVGSSIMLSVAIGVLAGFRSAWRRGTAADVGSLTAFMVVDSMPAFFVGMLLILAFSVTVHIFPIYGAVPTLPTTGFELVVAIVKRLALPLTALTLSSLGAVYLVARSSMVSELREEYVLMAEAKGLDRSQVRRHAQRNALLPVWTIVLLSVGHLVGGATVVETIFSYPGLGQLIYQSVLSRDYPVLQGAFFLLAFTVVAANLLADLVYPIIDPRVRRRKGARA